MAGTTLNQYAGLDPVAYTNTGATPAFLPQTPGYERGLRNLTDQYHSSLANIAQQRAGLGSAYNQQFNRMGTDVRMARRDLAGNMTGRGLYNSSARSVLDRNQIQMPYARNLQDMNQQMNTAYGQLAQAEQNAYLGYNQGIADLLLQRAADAANMMPYGLPQTGSQDRTYDMGDYWFDPNNVTAPYGSDSAYASSSSSSGSGGTRLTRRERRRRRLRRSAG